MILGFFEPFFLQGGEPSEIQFPCGDQSSRSMIETRAEQRRKSETAFLPSLALTLPIAVKLLT